MAMDQYSDRIELVPVVRPRLADLASVIPYLQAMESAQIYSNGGPLVRSLEARLGSAFQVDPGRVIAVSSATLGLQACLEVCGSPAWLAPAWSFAATGQAVLNAGFQPEWRDVSSCDWTVQPQPTEVECLSNVGILVTLPFGADLSNSWTDWSRTKCVVIDAAASLGANLDPLSRSDFDIPTVFSLHATKLLGCGEGGLVVAPDESFAAEVRAFSNFGFASHRMAVRSGTNAKMSEAMAAYAHAALDGREVELAEWSDLDAKARQLSERYSLPYRDINSTGVSPYWLLDFSETPDSVPLFESILRSHAIESRFWWPEPLPSMPAFSGDSVIKYPNAERLAHNVIGLPKWRGMTQKHWDRIESALDRFVVELAG